MSRRNVLALGGAASAAALLGERRAGAAPKAHPQVPRRVLGKTGQKIPILLVGGGAGFKAKLDPRISVALRYGVDYIDTARKYAGGRSEPRAAESLKKLGALDKTWITSKSGHWNAKGFEQDVSLSLSKIGRSHVDLYFLHGLDELGPLDDKELQKTVERLKKAGKIRFFGFSCHGGNVVELLHAASKRPFVDAVMFRYNFRKYGDKELHRAIDAAHKANVGLIAMKTQASEIGLEKAIEKFEKTGKYNKYQAALKAVWADKRISAAVSHMEDIHQVKDNVAAALDKKSLSLSERKALRRYAEATRAHACDGCEHLCGTAAGAPLRVGDTLRYLMYHDSYGQKAEARALFRALPAGARTLERADLAAATRACPHGVDVEAKLRRALRVLA